MTAIRNLAKNTFVLAISQFIVLASGFVYFVSMARYLGVENFGILSFALALTGILSVVADLGLSQLTIRDVARKTDFASKYLKNSLSAKFISGSIFLFIIFLIITLLNYPLTKNEVVIIIALSAFFNSLYQIGYSIFSAYEKMEYKALGDVLNSFCLLSGTIICVYFKYNLISFSLLYLISNFLVLIYVMLITNWKFVKIEFEFDTVFLATTIKQALPFGMSSIFTSIYYQVDSVMLSILDNDNSVGIYNAAYRLIYAILVIRIVMHSAIFPSLSRSFMCKSKEDFIIISDNLFKYLFMIIIPIAIWITILADKIVLMLYGIQYIDSANPLRILIWANVIIFINSYPRLFEAANRQVLFTKIALIGALLNVLLNFIMIPYWSYIGASIATVFTEFIILIISYKLATPSIYNIKKSKFRSTSLYILCCGFVMGLFTTLFSNYNLIFVVIASGLIYFFLLFKTKVLDLQDIYFKQIYKLTNYKN